MASRSGDGPADQNGPVVWSNRAGVRLAAAGVFGVVAAFLSGRFESWSFSLVAGWIAAAAVFLVWNWAVIGRMNAADTAAHATREDPTRAASEIVVLFASLGSLAGVALLLINSGGNKSGLAAALALGSVASAWLVVHTLFTLRYAKLFYAGAPGGVEFNQDEAPRYRDFAYLAFTIGMTYQVSDTELQDSEIRAAALRHALLSFLLGAVILASTINLVAGLGGSSK